MTPEGRALLGWADGGVCPYVGPDALVWAAGHQPGPNAMLEGN